MSTIIFADSIKPLNKISKYLIDKYKLTKEFIEYAEHVENIEITCNCLQCGKEFIHYRKNIRICPCGLKMELKIKREKEGDL